MQRKIVNFVDYPVNVIAKRRALFFDLVIMGNCGRRTITSDSQRIGGKPERRKPRDGFGLGVGQGFG